MADELDQSFEDINAVKLHNEFQDRLEENISKTDEQIKSIENPSDKTDIKVNLPNEDQLSGLMKNIQNMNQKDRNNLLANLMPMINGNMNPNNKTFSTVGDNDRKFLMEKLKAKREQMTIMRKPKKHIEQHVQQQMEKIKNSAGTTTTPNVESQNSAIDIAGNVVPVQPMESQNSLSDFKIPAGLTKSQKKRMKKKMKAMAQKSETGSHAKSNENDSDSD